MTEVRGKHSKSIVTWMEKVCFNKRVHFRQSQCQHHMYPMLCPGNLISIWAKAVPSCKRLAFLHRTVFGVGETVSSNSSPWARFELQRA